MELFRTNEFFIFVKGEFSLWWDRQTGASIPKTGQLFYFQTCLVNNNLNEIIPPPDQFMLNCHVGL